MAEDFKGKTYKQFVFIYKLTLLLMIGLGIYYNYTGKTTGGTLYGRFGGSATVTYGGNGFFIMVGALLFGLFLIFVFSKNPDHNNKTKNKKPH